MQPSHKILKKTKILKDKKLIYIQTLQETTLSRIVGLSLSMEEIYLSLLSPLKAFNDQPSKKMIACEEKNTLRSEHSSNIPRQSSETSGKLHFFNENQCLCLSFS